MARLIWIGIGAVGGIYVYRRGERAVDAVRAQGLSATAQILAASALRSLPAVRESLDGGSQPVAATPAGLPGLQVGGFRISRSQRPADLPPTIVDTGVVDLTDAARSDAARRKAR